MIEDIDQLYFFDLDIDQGYGLYVTYSKELVVFTFDIDAQDKS